MAPATTRRDGTVGGLVLAGGLGRRFGRPKADVRIEGRTLVERAVAALGPWCAEVVVASRSPVPLPELAVPVVLDGPGEPSALAGLASGLAAHTADVVLVLACDVVVEQDLLERLLHAPGESAVVVDDHGVQPLCARYRRDRALDACQRLLAGGDRRVRRLADLVAATPVTVRPGELRNVNTWPDALAASLDVPPLSPEAVDLVLALTRDVAHGTERRNGPVASFLAGLAAGRRGEDVEAVLAEAIARTGELLPGEPDGAGRADGPEGTGG